MQLEEKPKDGIVGKGFLYIIGGIVGFFLSMIILWLLFPKLESPVIPVIVSIALVISGIIYFVRKEHRAIRLDKKVAYHSANILKESTNSFNNIASIKTRDESAPENILQEAGNITISKLISCPDCGKKVSRRAVSCPNCGCPISELPEELQTIQQLNVYVLKCPTCQSTNVDRISTGKKLAYIAGFGLLSPVFKKVRSQFECKSCGYKW